MAPLQPGKVHLNNCMVDDDVINLTKLHIDQQTHLLRSWTVQSTLALAIVTLYAAGVERGLAAGALLLIVGPLIVVMAIAFMRIQYKHQDRIRQISEIMQERASSSSSASQRLIKKFQSDSPWAVLFLSLTTSLAASAAAVFIYLSASAP